MSQPQPANQVNPLRRWALVDRCGTTLCLAGSLPSLFERALEDGLAYRETGSGGNGGQPDAGYNGDYTEEPRYANGVDHCTCGGEFDKDDECATCGLPQLTEDEATDYAPILAAYTRHQKARDILETIHPRTGGR